MQNRAWVGLVAIGALALAGCGRGEGAEAAASADSSVVDAGQQGGYWVEGTPAGGLESWLSDIASEMPTDGSALTSQWQETHRTLLELYVGRQEFVEMYWGPHGRLQGEGGSALGQAVLDLETAFHEVLQGLVSVPLDTAAVLSAAARVKRQTAVVRDAAKESGLPLIPPADSTVAAAR
ncbi:MAG: hypothetical protein PVH00_04425 [Gemmatimonadota bacterium]